VPKGLRAALKALDGLDVLGLFGILFVSLGGFLVYAPLGLIVPGAIFLTVAAVGNMRRGRRTG